METPPAGNGTLSCLDCPFWFYFVMFCFLRYQGWMQLSKLRLIWLFMIDQRLRSSGLTLQAPFSLMGRKPGSFVCPLAIGVEALPYLGIRGLGSSPVSSGKPVCTSYNTRCYLSVHPCVFAFCHLDFSILTFHPRLQRTSEVAFPEFDLLSCHFVPSDLSHPRS